MMIPRKVELEEIRRMFRVFRLVGILGARQVGKTTLAGQFANTYKGEVHRFDLEDPRDLARLDDPMTALEHLRGLVILDEIQRRPDLFPVLRVLADQPRVRRHFLVLGSVAPEFLRQSSETLAGRIGYFEIAGLGLEHLGIGKHDQLWLRGGMPQSFLAASNAASLEWREGYLRAFVERELVQYDVRIPARTLDQLLHMIAHFHGQILTMSELGTAFGVSDKTVQRYVDLFASTFLVRFLRPWHENLKKRQVKRPKVYIADSGLLHALLDIRDGRGRDRHPKVGFSWEGFAMDAVIRRLRANPQNCYFWATHTGAELDLLIVHRNKRFGFEFKRNSAPTLTKSMRTAVHDLGLYYLKVIHPGKTSWPMDRRVRAVCLADTDKELRRLG